ncbi:MAG: Si-specific NAD(P)(+) transhydrogenase [Candidatus Marinimicrobia bacterium]|nr:Si-specific NAD(P)(+) transhydrogenase [Candidatus Neomarinimicrobiota bacterium]
MKKYDIIVIGSGPAGQKAAIESSKAGKIVAVVEKKELVGGVCLHAGTIPSKTLRAAAMYFTGSNLKELYGRNYRVKDKITMKDLLFRTNRVIASELNVIEEHFHRYNIDIFYGEAQFIDDHQIEIIRVEGPEQIYGEKIILAVGTRAYRPPNIPFNDRTIIDSDQIMNMEELPNRIIILGAGVIGIEYASIFSILGVDVTVISRADKVFGFIDREITDKLVCHLRENSVRLILNDEIEKVSESEGDQLKVQLKSGKQISADLLLTASGRSGCGLDINSEAAGVIVNTRGLFDVDENYLTNKQHIYAVGDVIGFPSLASTSLEQGRKAAQHAVKGDFSKNYQNHPFGIYSIPGIAYVGKNEEELSEERIPYISGVAHYREIAKGQIIEDHTGYLKMLFHQSNKKLLGVHIIGSGATELIHIAQAVINYSGDLNYFLDAVFNYPTLAECYKIAAINAERKFREM